MIEPQNGALHIITGGHDGLIKIWDIRNYQCVAEVSSIKNGHQRKFDEGVMCLSAHPDAPFIASGGSDCVVNMYEVNLQ